MELWNLPEADNPAIAVGEKSPFLEQFLREADAFWDSQRTGPFRSETWVEKSPAGREIPLEALALDLQGERFLALHSPQPEFQERVELLQTARNALLDQEKLQREIQKKEILLHCIIHDLSQPLSVMSVTFDSMADERISEKGKELLELGRKASDQQLAMIRDILQVFSADLQATLKADDKAESPDLMASAEAARKVFQPVFAAKNVSLRLEGKNRLGEAWRVHGEARRIERIFSNLLENALRYSPPGSRVSIGVAQDGEFIRAFVDDEGPGLPADMTSAQIFALFSKGKEGGGKAGLGLYFCRLTVERWGGSIGCESLPTRGSRFWFKLRKAAPPLASASGVRQSRAERLPRVRNSNETSAKELPVRVLLAEDQQEIRLLTALQLERRGHRVVSVANGEEALKALAREPFDIVLLDQDMPGMTGLEAMRAIRERHSEFGPMLLIALTGYNSEPDRDRLLAAGFDRVIGKPFRLDALDRIVRGPAGEMPPPAEIDESPAKPASMAHLLDRLGGDGKLARQMVATFLRDTPKRVAGIESSLRQKNAEKLTSLAHALKGSVAIFGAARARDCAEKLQDLGRAQDFQGSASVYKQLKEEIAKLEANLRGYAVQKRSRDRGANSKTKRRTSNPKWR